LGEFERSESALDYEDIQARLDFANRCLSIPKKAINIFAISENWVNWNCQKISIIDKKYDCQKFDI